jgi:hypothetical protein
VGVRYRFALVDGGSITGTVVSAGETEIVVTDARGLETTLPRARVASFSPVTGAFDRTDPNATRLLLFPTARSLPAGAGRFGTYTVFPTVAYGVTNALDVSLGATIPVEGFGVLNLNAKATPIETDAFSAAVGASALLPYGEDAGGVGGTFYGALTFGTPEQAFTVGGVGVYGGDDPGDLEVGAGGALMVGFERQLSEGVKFLTENYVGLADSEIGLLASAGVRFFGDNLSADIAPILAAGDGEVTFFPIPYFSFSYSFGR